MFHGELNIWILGSVLLLLIGYLLNGWRERSLERKKTNYKAKLGYFERVNEDVGHLRAVIISFKIVVNTAWEEMGEEEAPLELAYRIALARDEETSLGSTTMEANLEDLKIASAVEDKEEKRAGLHHWLDKAKVNLTVLYARLLVHYLNRLNRTGADVYLIAETPAVIRDIQAIQKHAVAEVERTDVNIEELKRIEEIEGRILPLVDQLRRSMRAEVQQTLASFPEKLWNRALAIAISLRKEDGGEPAPPSFPPSMFSDFLKANTRPGQEVSLGPGQTGKVAVLPNGEYTLVAEPGVYQVKGSPAALASSERQQEEE